MATMQDLGLDANTNPTDVLSALIAQFGYDAVMQGIMALNDQEEAAEGTDGTSATSVAPAAPQLGRSATLADAVKLEKLKKLLAGNTAVLRTQAPDPKIAAMEAEIAAMKRAMLAAPVTPTLAPNRAQRDDVPVENMRDRRFDLVNAPALAWAYNALFVSGKSISPSFTRALHYKIMQEQDRGGKAASEYAVRMASPYRKAEDVFSHDFGYIRANEIDNTAAAAKGLEWVGTYYETDLWQVVRISPIWDMLLSRGMYEKSVPRGYSSDIIPIEGADLTWFTIGEATGIDATNRPTVTYGLSNSGTGKATITVKKLGCAAAFTGELDEDSLIGQAEDLNRKIQIQGQEQIENVILNGDTVGTASTNLNLIDGTPGTGLAAPNYLVMDGMLKNAIITLTSNSRDAAGSFNKLAYRQLKTYLGVNGKAGNDPKKLLYVIDTGTRDATLDLPELLTRDVSSVATIESGDVKGIYGVDVMVSGQMGLANTAGKISATPSNNSKGRILLTRPDQWAIAFKREVTTERERYALSDTTVFVTALRLGMITRDSDSASAVSFNIPV